MPRVRQPEDGAGDVGVRGPGRGTERLVRTAARGRLWSVRGAGAVLYGLSPG
jgi:hypothetical protein